MITCCKNGNAVEIQVDGELILCIDETSDRETINLFFTVIKGIIVETKKCTSESMPWSHELLADR